MKIFFYSLFIFILHLIFQYKTYYLKKDYDTASHLYSAFLKKSKVICRESYSMGIKWFMPKIYFFYLSYIPQKKFYDHRIINTIFSSLFIFSFILLNVDNTYLFYLYVFFIVLFINSFYVNFQTSSTEFIDTPIIFNLLMIVYSYDSSFLLLFISILILFLSLATKIINIIYLIPIFTKDNFNENLYIYSVIIILSIIVVYLAYKNSFKNIKSYSNTRKTFSLKNFKFLLLNPFFVILNIYLSYSIIKNGDFFIISIIICVWLIFLIQKSYTSYFWYPIIIINLILNFKLKTNFEIFHFILVLPQIFYSIYLLIYGYEYNKKNISELFFLGNGLKSVNKTNYLISDYKIKNIDFIRSKRVYLWGSNVNILLENEIKHISDTFYNHNHLFFWSTIKDKKNYILNFLSNNKPEIIIESGVMNGFNFPLNKFTSYKLLEKNDICNIYVINNYEI